MIIIAATQNKHKIYEFGKIFGVKVYPAAELGIFTDPEEDGTTFAENSEIKARAIYEEVKKLDNIPDNEYIVVADDSGLCVDALGGAPGIYSARYASTDGHNSNDEENLQKVLDELKDVPAGKRQAYFACAIFAVDQNGKATHTEARIYGEIIREKKGKNGFGYDPIFFVPEYGKTTAELSVEEKNAISHRGKALRQLKEILWS